MAVSSEMYGRVCQENAVLREQLQELKDRAIYTEDELEAKAKAITELVEGLREIYAMRGEDEIISGVADPLIESYRFGA